MTRDLCHHLKINQAPAHRETTVAHKCHAKIVIFFYFSDFFSDFLSDFFSDFFSDFLSDFFSGLKLLNVGTGDC